MLLYQAMGLCDSDGLFRGPLLSKIQLNYIPDLIQGLSVQTGIRCSSLAISLVYAQ